jgi:hypothetical protein
MSAAEKPTAPTALRSFELRTRGLPLEAQMVECVDLLQAPEFVVDDLVQSVAQVHAAAEVVDAVELISEEEGPRDPREAFFYPSRELFVQGDGCSFTCLATALEFQETAGASDDADAGGPRRIDYAAVTCEARPLPVLGFVQSTQSESAYPLLLRGLSSLIELVKPRRFDLLDRDVYRGLLGPAPVFDLALVLWDDDLEPDARRPLCELSRDLAEVLKAALRAELRFPPILHDVVCLRMNPHRFDGRLRFVWRV